MDFEDCVDRMGHKQPGYTFLHDSTDGYEEIAWRQQTATGDTKPILMAVKYIYLLYSISVSRALTISV